MIKIDMEKGYKELSGEIPVILTELTTIAGFMYEKMTPLIGKAGARELLEDALDLAIGKRKEVIERTAKKRNMTKEEFIADFMKFIEESDDEEDEEDE